MDSLRSTAAERSTLTFCVEGLQAREELLFKAFVRLLDHLTHQQWVYHAPSAEQRIDLLVVADGTQPTFSQAAQQPPQPVLRLGSGGADGHGVLSWPLKPDALEKELNRLGEQILRQRGAVPAESLFAGAAASTPLALNPSRDLMRLQQWPPTRLLAGSGRMRLATLLTGKAMSLDELVHRSALPIALCTAFIGDLQSAGLLHTKAAPPTPAPVQPASRPAPKTTQPGLLNRIRMRLGIPSFGR